MNTILRGIGQKYAILTIMLVFLGIVAQGQRIVRGTVSSSATGETLPGVNVVIQGTAKGTITDIDGNFQLELMPENQILIFSFIGFDQQTVLVGDRQVLHVELVPAATALEEVVVIGYGAQRVRDLTAPIVRVSGEDLARQTSSNVLQALQGKASGVQIIQSGAPGRGPVVRIRGLGSIGDYANPLFVVDGVFVDNIDFISSSDIEDVTILKDASAAAIFGVRAANGVILITTRKGRVGRPTVSYEGFFGMQVPVNILPLASTQQYVELFNEANVNRTGFVPKDPADYTASTDWYRELLRMAPMTSHSFDISGTGQGSNYSIGGSFLNQLGIMDFNNHYQRLNLRARLDQAVNEYIKIGINSIISRHDQYNPNDGAFFQAFVNPPVYPVFDENNQEAFPR
ncbi:MAG TPA: carboxypeptidase-like regulatory domain-containing protein, partial [Bacteroidales bacterium]|nr:carboxypeptidase-like regulatory domain-containing protein [Bacteroidales bacterium]